MTNEEYVILLQKKEKDLVRIANYYGFYGDNCKDVIQDLYLLLLEYKNVEKYILNGEPNMYVIFVILKNIIYHFRKKEQRYSKEPLYDFDIPEEEDIDEATIDKYNFIIKEINNIQYWWNKQLIKLYLDDGHTIRSLSKATDIGTNVIHRTIFNFKVEVKKKWKNKKQK